MPDLRILKALGMSPADWGALPPESVSPVRNELKAKAREIIAKEADSRIHENASLHQRVAALELKVFGKEKPKPEQPIASPPGESKPVPPLATKPAFEQKEED